MKTYCQFILVYIDRDRLKEFLEEKMAESIEMVEMCVTSPQDVNNQTFESEKTSNSIYRNKKYSQKSTAKQSAPINSKSDSFAAARSNLHSEGLTTSPGQNRAKSDSSKSNPNESKRVLGVDFIVNKELIELLDSTGVPINRTIRDLLKLYSKEKVEKAIAIVKARKREKHIPNPSGYFVAALKGGWGARKPRCIEAVRRRPQGSTNVVSSSEENKGAVFHHWYELARELGYCSGQEVREGQQWICLSGSWEKWSDAVNRGYSLEYLKKIMKRSQGQ